MNLTKEQPPPAPPEYMLRMSYPELHQLSKELDRVYFEFDELAMRRLRELLREHA